MMFKKVVVLALMATSCEAFSPIKQAENRFRTTHTHNIPRYSGILDRNVSLRMMGDSEQQPPRKLSKKEESLLEVQESLMAAEARNRKLEEDRLRIEQEMALAKSEQEALHTKISQLETKPDPLFNPAATAAGFAFPLAAAVAGRNALSSRPKVKIQKQQQQNQIKQQQQKQIKQQRKSPSPLGKFLGRNNEVGGTKRVERRDADIQKKNRTSGTVPTAPKVSPLQSLLKKSRKAARVDGTKPTAPKTTPFPGLLKKVKQSQEIQDEIAGVVQTPKTAPLANLVRSKRAGIVKEAPKEENFLKAPTFNFMAPFENVTPPKPTSSGTRSIAEAKRRQKVEKKSNPAVGGAVATAAAAAVIFSTAQGPGLSILKNVARVESPLNKAKTEKVEVATRKNAKKAAAETPESPSSGSAVSKKPLPETPPTTSVEKDIPLKEATVKASVPQEAEFTVNESLEAKLLANSKDMNAPAEAETAVPEVQKPLESTVIEATKVAEVTEGPAIVKELAQSVQTPTDPTSTSLIEQTSTLTASEPIKGSFGSTFAPTDVQSTTSTQATEIKPAARVAPEVLEVPAETVLPFAKPATPPLNPTAIAAAKNDATPPAPVSEVTSTTAVTNSKPVEIQASEVKPEAPVVELKAAELKPISPIAEIKPAAPLSSNVAEIPKFAEELKPFVPVVPVVPIVPPKSESETESSAPTVSSTPKEEVQKPALKVVSEVESPKIITEKSLKVQTPNKEKLKDLTNPFAGSVLSPLKIVNEDPKPFNFPNPLQAVTGGGNDVKKSLTSAENNEPSLQNKVVTSEKSGSLNFLNPFSQRGEKETKAEVVAAPVPFETKNFLKSLSFNRGEDTSVKATPQVEKQGKGLSNFAVPIGGAAALTFAAVAVAVGVSDDDDEIIMEAPKMGGTYDGPFTQDAVYGNMNVQTNGAFVKHDKVKLNNNGAVKLNGPPTIGSTPAYEENNDSSYLSSLKNGSTSPVGGGVPSYLDTLKGSTTVTGEGPISYLDRL